MSSRDVLPAPISWEPSEYWDGYDGQWSSFHLRVGTPPQIVRVLVSTAGQATWVVVGPEGCPSNIPNCAQSRGGLFNVNTSDTWKFKANATLALEENLGYGDVVAMLGFDSLALGLSNATGGLPLKSQVIDGLISNEYYNGMFGLGNQPTNITNFDDPHPSFLTNLKSNNLIPSLSWGYTAGAHYQNSFGSLTLGGYDLSKFVPNNVTFFLAGDISRDIVVNLQSITSTNSIDSLGSLLPSPISIFIDSTFPYIYLPTAACKAFEEQFDLVWNSSLNMYIVDDNLHKTLLASKPEFTFRIENPTNDGRTVDIVLPYSSFDLTATYPMVDNTTRYFPLQRGNESQYVLGRTFLQEAYLIVDYERSHFSVSQRKFQGDPKKDIVAITTTEPVLPMPSDRPSTSSHLSLKLMIGLATGTALLLILGFLMIILFMRKRRSRARRVGNSPYRQQEVPKEIPDSGKAELHDPQTTDNPHYYFRELQVDRLSHKLRYEGADSPQPHKPTIHELMASSIPIELNTHGRTPKTGTPTTKHSIRSSSSLSSSSEPNPPRPTLSEKIRSSVQRISLSLNRPLPPIPTPPISPPVSKKQAKTSRREAVVLSPQIEKFWKPSSRKSSWESGRAVDARGSFF